MVFAAVDDPVPVVGEATLSLPLASAHRFGGGKDPGFRLPRLPTLVMVFAAVDAPVAVVGEATLSLPLASAGRFGGGMAAS